MTKRSVTIIAVAAIIIGSICLAPRLYSPFTGARPDLSAEEVSAALTPIVRIPLSSFSLTGSATTQFEIKPTRTWHVWGAPHYHVLGRTQRLSVIPFDSLGVEVRLTIDSEPVSLNEAKHVPYGYSSETRDLGRVFSAKPGTAQFTVTGHPPESLRDAELLVTPDWNVAVKDKLVGLEINEELMLFTRYLSWIGTVFITAGVILFAFRQRLPNRTRTEYNADHEHQRH
jgi:hypothetical protein